MKRISILTLLLAIFSLAILTSCEQEKAEPKAKYVFLFIGDGMGISHVSAAEEYQAQMNDVEKAPLGFSKFPVVSMSTTYAANRFITGSAAAGTALATGQKTNIGRISMDTSGKMPIETIAEKAKKAGFRVGIISSVSIDHATPACFYAHQISRNMYHEIGIDLAQSDIDFFGGGGFKNPVVEGVDVVGMAVENGFNYINDSESFRALSTAEGKVLFANPELCSGAAMHYAIDQPEGYITLAEITQKAIEYLYNDKGFFMMVEGGKIDWLSHANDAGSMVREVIDFSAAVDQAFEFYQKHPDETLIIVTADHETGGLGLGYVTTKYETDFALLANQKMSGEQFNMLLTEWRKNNHLNEKGYKIMLKLIEENFGIGGENAISPMTKNENADLKQAFLAFDLIQEGDYTNYSPVTYLSTQILNHHAGLGWTSTSHTGVSVPVYAIGVNSIAFSQKIDNTDIPKVIWETMN